MPKPYRLMLQNTPRCPCAAVEDEHGRWRYCITSQLRLFSRMAHKIRTELRSYPIRHPEGSSSASGPRLSVAEVQEASVTYLKGYLRIQMI
jgi:hypothetical protein